ncbi:MAG: DUF4254 domain-containing protein [Bacteroidetes bacterium]|uniref:DUF4254 domain-containing protein n=1 Tax=Phaeocystidibacter marisrubri TaxID=1577780 RepID=A0A6L3ZEB8_9FLAO|nr:DUF4254 domain-containing protein [Phaeocystidibacter marisrubri]KAB2816020.1 DUF4254 domain-containing protein [Phaeocystidibacter marisrubri]TNE27878.1 MAG: DUF4254 domain-containing protein [Bacteroidota bacterium]GGH66928.1 hypothetical protein GCM10011318_05370 [Phaeocystidibacter marisrubri]
MSASFTEKCWEIFNRSIADYHVHDNVDQPMNNPHEEGTIEATLYHKNWIDTVQWHFEDIIRDPQIDPVSALALKRRIDASNQDRTDMVEEIDTWFREKYADVEVADDAKINTESPAWAIDRFSILALKIYHMREEVERTDVSPEHHAKVSAKLAVLEEQHTDLSTAIEELLEDFAAGKKYMKVYRQMKMYNDPALNPVLYKQSK